MISRDATRRGRPLSLTLVTAALCASLVAGCAQPDVTATLADDGSHVDLGRGEILDIVLPDNYTPRTNLWRAKDTHDLSVLTRLGAQYDPQATTPGQNTPGVYTSRYQGNEPGTVHVTLTAEDDRAQPTRVIRRFAIDVTVH